MVVQYEQQFCCGIYMHIILYSMSAYPPWWISLFCSVFWLLLIAGAAILMPYHVCNSFEDPEPVDVFYKYSIFKWVAVTWLKERRASRFYRQSLPPGDTGPIEDTPYNPVQVGAVNQLKIKSNDTRSANKLQLTKCFCVLNLMRLSPICSDSVNYRRFRYGLNAIHATCHYLKRRWPTSLVHICDMD